jgi:hypothetical protein
MDGPLLQAESRAMLALHVPQSREPEQIPLELPTAAWYFVSRLNQTRTPT